jgi:hypothetical protein
MEHLQIFETFTSSQNTRPGGKFKATIEFDSSNPDAKYGATVIGVGNSPLEAAEFALAAAWSYATEGNTEGIKDSKQAYEILKGIYSDEELREIVNRAATGDIDSDIFGDHGTESDAWCEVDGTNGGENGGYVTHSY